MGNATRWREVQPLWASVVPSGATAGGNQWQLLSSPWHRLRGSDLSRSHPGRDSSLHLVEAIIPDIGWSQEDHCGQQGQAFIWGVTSKSETPRITLLSGRSAEWAGQEVEGAGSLWGGRWRSFGDTGGPSDVGLWWGGHLSDSSWWRRRACPVLQWFWGANSHRLPGTSWLGIVLHNLSGGQAEDEGKGSQQRLLAFAEGKGKEQVQGQELKIRNLFWLSQSPEDPCREDCHIDMQKVLDARTLEEGVSKSTTSIVPAFEGSRADDHHGRGEWAEGESGGRDLHCFATNGKVLHHAGFGCDWAERTNFELSLGLFCAYERKFDFRVIWSTTCHSFESML